MDKRLKKLYQQAFDDDKKYVNYFFKKQVKENNVVKFEKDGEVISALYLINKTFRICFNGAVCPYIVGASTLESERGKGYFSQVMVTAFEQLENNRVPFVMLHPFDHKFYKQFGFETFSYMQQLSLDLGNPEYTYERLTRKNLAEAYEIYLFYLSRYNFYIKKSFKEFCDDFKRFSMTSKEAYLIKKNNTFFGYYMLDGDDYCQLIALSPKFYQTVSTLGEGKFMLNCKPKDKQANPFVMLRVVCLEKFLNLFRPLDKSPKSITLKVNDDYIQSNNGIWSITLRNGEVRVLPSKDYEAEVSIGDIVKSIVGTATPKKNVFKGWFDTLSVLIYDKY